MKIGIDPGISGAIAFLNDDLSFIKVEDMPVMPLSQKSMQVNGAALAKLLLSAPDNTPVYIEKVSAMPKQGVTSMFNFGMGYGVVKGVCCGLLLPIILVTPNAWKKEAGLAKKDKDYSRTVAQQLYPEAELSLKKHVGRADALLIARFS